eukprot:COSAG02_NODE_54435_length_296_cov_0.766497_1_plen_54_part_01
MHSAAEPYALVPSSFVGTMTMYSLIVVVSATGCNQESLGATLQRALSVQACPQD